MRPPSISLLAIAMTMSSGAFGECLTDQQLAPLVSTWKDDAPVSFSIPTELSIADANCSQDRLITLLTPAFGKIVGWKVAATSAAVQAAVRGGPTRGVLLEKMMDSEQSQPMKLVAGLRNFEADLILQVKDDGINNANSPLEIIEHLSHLIPFIELPNAAATFLPSGFKMTPALLTTINSVGRQGVVGKPVPLTASWAWVIALGTMSIVTVQDGKEVSRVSGAASLGNPLNAVGWLIQDLKASGKKLNAGDLISTGTFSPPVRPAKGQNFVVRYEGIPTDAKSAEVTVSFD